MTNINLDALTEIEELQSILVLYEEAHDFLESFSWCTAVKKVWYDKDFGIYEKLGIFLFEIEPVDDTVDDFIWVVMGDLPTVYLDKSITSGKDALERYCELMEEWADHVINNTSLEECYPVDAEPTVENAGLLNTRIAFIRKELLMTDIN